MEQATSAVWVLDKRGCRLTSYAIFLQLKCLHEIFNIQNASFLFRHFLLIIALFLKQQEILGPLGFILLL